MAFVKKTWKDRIAEFPTRRRLTKEDNTSELVTVAREEGTLSQEGDAFSAENMNDLENRIDAEFTALNGNLKMVKLYDGALSANDSATLPQSVTDFKKIIFENLHGTSIITTFGVIVDGRSSLRTVYYVNDSNFIYVNINDKSVKIEPSTHSSIKLTKIWGIY